MLFVTQPFQEEILKGKPRQHHQRLKNICFVKLRKKNRRHLMREGRTSWASASCCWMGDEGARRLPGSMLAASEMRWGWNWSLDVSIWFPQDKYLVFSTFKTRYYNISIWHLQDEGRKTRLVSRIPAQPVEGGGETSRNESIRIHFFLLKQRRETQNQMNFNG